MTLMTTNPVHRVWLTHMSAPHSDLDALRDWYTSKHLTKRILAKNYELYARFASHEPLDEFDMAIAAINGDKARGAIYPPIRGKK